MRAGDLRAGIERRGDSTGARPDGGPEVDAGAGLRSAVRLPPLVDATAAARHLVGRACRLWGVTQVSDLAQLVVTELVSNVVRHARTEMEVGVALRRRLLHVSVRDGSRDLPRLGASNDRLRDDGRGLLVVSALTDGWGCTPVPDGKVVWATLRL